MRYFLVVSILFTIAACGVKKQYPAGAPPKLKEDHLREAIINAQNDFENLVFKATCNFTEDGNSQRFRMEVRILKDSLIWLDIADPILGIKVARAVVYQDSVAFINRIERKYMCGKSGPIQQRFTPFFTYTFIEDMLSANLLMELGREFELFYRNSLYMMADYEADKPDSTISDDLRNMVYIGPANFKPVNQTRIEKAANRKYVVTNKDFNEVEGLQFPASMEVHYTSEKSDLKLQMEVKKVKKNIPVSYPFKIPEGYAEMQL